MGYNKIIRYSDIIEVYQYENEIHTRTIKNKSKCFQVARSRKVLASDGEVDVQQNQQKQTKRRDNARRSALVFRRLVSANLGQFDVPILVTLTYAKLVANVSKAHKDFNSFARATKNQFGKDIRYIAVPEFQKRGAIHFHALIWGIPTSVVREERHTRLVAKLWKQGFVDLILTDGNAKLSTYLGKYMAKAFVDTRLFSKKAFIASRNIKRPVVEKRAMILPFVYNELSTCSLLQDNEYMTNWLGKGRHRVYQQSIK